MRDTTHTANDDPPGANAAMAPAMRIAYLSQTDFAGTRTRDSLDILVPKAAANLFATCCTGSTRTRTSCIRAPLICFIPPQLPHSLIDRSGSNTLILSIEGPFFRTTAISTLGSSNLTFVEPHATANPLIREFCDVIEREFLSPDRLTSAFLDAFAALLVAHIARNYLVEGHAKAAPNGGLTAYKMQRVRDFITDHLCERISVELLASIVNLSPCHFARMFKQSTGHSPHLFILIQRIMRAKILLAGTDSPIIDIATEVGFRTQGHFTGVFHRYTGFTPRIFRLNAQDPRGGGVQLSGSILAGGQDRPENPPDYFSDAVPELRQLPRPA
ncbi:helix-turn-helix domain-containing protein [Pseudomonas fluorescens]|uniref:HTH-type transcriptional activator RhaS n=1 Tax=Pseudomonas fluorescens TaxID=294 RepID=A0A5E7EIF4_PSEFL|nr:AraC family transcriptional regulator [Pseudomonas fluorescens]VVO26057.1 HTH-type transcriptional activator RhaS [Pseudomonas fluorescens]